MPISAVETGTSDPGRLRRKVMARVIRSSASEYRCSEAPSSRSAISRASPESDGGGDLGAALAMSWAALSQFKNVDVVVGKSPSSSRQFSLIAFAASRIHGRTGEGTGGVGLLFIQQPLRFSSQRSSVSVLQPLRKWPVR